MDSSLEMDVIRNPLFNLQWEIDIVYTVLLISHDAHYLEWMINCVENSNGKHFLKCVEWNTFFGVIEPTRVCYEGQVLRIENWANFPIPI